MGRAASVVVALTLASCGGAAQPSPTPTTPASAAATAATSPSATGPWSFTVDAASKVTIRVREVLADIRAPGDAMLAATGMLGPFTLEREATRSGAKLTASATADPAFRLADFGVRKPLVASDLSIEDDIRVEVALVANETER